MGDASDIKGCDTMHETRHHQYRDVTFVTALLTCIFFSLRSRSRVTSCSRLPADSVSYDACPP